MVVAVAVVVVETVPLVALAPVSVRREVRTIDATQRYAHSLYVGGAQGS